MAKLARVPRLPFAFVVRGGKMTSIAGDRVPSVIVKSDPKVRSALRSESSKIGKSRFA